MSQAGAPTSASPYDFFVKLAAAHASNAGGSGVASTGGDGDGGGGAARTSQGAHAGPDKDAAGTIVCTKPLIILFRDYLPEESWYHS